jgi:hypothetical protein
MIKWSVRCYGDAYAMPLYECDNMTRLMVEQLLLERNCLEKDEYELYSEYIEE